MFELNGKVALVTGAASGIGYACVEELLKNEVKGVALVDIDDGRGQRALNSIIKSYGKNCAIFVKADVNNRKQFENAFETTVMTFKQLDIVINNAGVMNETEWERCIGINLTGVITGSILANDKYLPKYRSSDEGVVINTSSQFGFQPMEECPVYCATKHGVVGFTRAMGGDTRYQTSKVRILAVCPGLTETPILNMTEEQIPQPFLSNLKGVIKSLESQKPEILAQNMINLIRDAPTGSIWEVAAGKCSQVEFKQYF